MLQAKDQAGAGAGSGEPGSRSVLGRGGRPGPQPGNGKGWIATVITATGDELEFKVPYAERQDFIDRMTDDGARSIKAVKDNASPSRREETWL